MPAVETAFAVVIAAYLTVLTAAMGYFAFVVSERQDLEPVSPVEAVDEAESTDAASTA